MAMPTKNGQHGFGCEDCGASWTRKKDVATECRPYVGAVVSVPDAYDRSMFVWEWSNDEDPVWS